MIGRAVLVAAAAAALILAPTAAMAQAPAGFGVPAADPPVAGVPFTVHATGAKANEVVTLTMTPDPASIGTRSLTKIADASGVVDFAVTLTEDGTYVLTSTSASGADLGTQTVTVSDHGAVIVAGTSAAAGKAASAAAGKAASAAAGKAVSAAPGKAVSAAPGKAVSASTGTAARAQLSFTGFGGMSLVVGGVVLVLAGTGLVLVTRRRTLRQP
jgi:pilus assembly protein FimV